MVLPSKIRAAGEKAGSCWWGFPPTHHPHSGHHEAREVHSVPSTPALLTVLVDEHADGDAAEVEAVQKVLDILVGDRVIAVRVLVLQHALRHGGHHVVVAVPDGDQGVREPAGHGLVPNWGRPQTLSHF